VNLDHVFAKVTTSVMFQGVPEGMLLGQHYLADDPLVIAHPDLFTKDCRYGLKWSGEPPEVMRLPPDADEPEPDGLPPRRPRAQAGRT
jgi:hypothetical protein